MINRVTTDDAIMKNLINHIWDNVGSFIVMFMYEQLIGILVYCSISDIIDEDIFESINYDSQD